MQEHFLLQKQSTYLNLKNSFLLQNANHQLSFQWMIITDHRSSWQINNKKVWNIMRTTRMWPETRSEQMLENGCQQTCRHRVATDLQFLRNAFLAKRSAARLGSHELRQHPEASSKTVYFLPLNMNPSLKIRQHPLFALPPANIRDGWQSTKLDGARIHGFSVFSWKGTNVRFQSLGLFCLGIPETQESVGALELLG